MNKITKKVETIGKMKYYILFENGKKFAFYGTKNIVRDEKKEVKK